MWRFFPRRENQPPVSDGQTETIGGQSIAWDQQDTDVDSALGDRFTKMDYIDNEKIAAGGKLNLNPNAYPSAVHPMRLYPVNVTRDFLCPRSRGFESGIEELSNRGTSVGIPSLFHA